MSGAWLLLNSTTSFLIQKGLGCHVEKGMAVAIPRDLSPQITPPDTKPGQRPDHRQPVVPIRYLVNFAGVHP